jgi:hypothetical protein
MPTRNDPRSGLGRDDRLIHLAKELATGIRERKDVLASIGMEADEWANVSVSPEFIALLLEEKRHWLETVNARTRTRTKTAALLEHIVEQVSGDIVDPTLPLGSRTQLLKVLAGIGGLGEMSGEMATVSTGNVFNLMINYSNGETSEVITLGEKRQEVAIDVPFNENSGEEDGREEVGEGPSNRNTITPSYPSTPPAASTRSPRSNNPLLGPRWVDTTPLPSAAKKVEDDDNVEDDSVSPWEDN